MLWNCLFTSSSIQGKQSTVMTTVGWQVCVAVENVVLLLLACVFVQPYPGFLHIRAVSTSIPTGM